MLTKSAWQFLMWPIQRLQCRPAELNTLNHLVTGQRIMINSQTWKAMDAFMWIYIWPLESVCWIDLHVGLQLPIGSMYGISIYSWLTFMENVGKNYHAWILWVVYIFMCACSLLAQGPIFLFMRNSLEVPPHKKVLKPTWIGMTWSVKQKEKCTHSWTPNRTNVPNTWQ